MYNHALYPNKEAANKSLRGESQKQSGNGGERWLLCCEDRIATKGKILISHSDVVSVKHPQRNSLWGCRKSSVMYTRSSGL